MGDSGYQFGTGIGEEELARLEAQGAAIAPATCPLAEASKSGAGGARTHDRRIMSPLL